MTGRRLPRPRARARGESFDALELWNAAAPNSCPRCEAGPWAPCINPLTGEDLHIPHWQRLPRPDRPQQTEETTTDA